MSNCEYRPCEVEGKQGIFHTWVQTATPIPAENLRGGAPAGQLMQVLAIIEYEDGSISLEHPRKVVFTDLLAMKFNMTERKIDKWKNLN